MPSILRDILEILPYLLKVIPGLRLLLESLTGPDKGLVAQEVREILDGPEIQNVSELLKRLKQKP